LNRGRQLRSAGRPSGWALAHILVLWKGFESLVVGEQNADIADTLQLWNVTMANTFWLSIRYDFGCVIARCLILGVSFRG